MYKSKNEFIYQEESSSQDHDEAFNDFDFISNYSQHTPDRDIQATDNKLPHHYKTSRHKKCKLVMNR
ncbi:hypothetical protein [Haloplasma contractile]|uniref:Uncharacterized protein n=1 Tax=Haloplasma contractile SSD-17B TaxID=1033810 RepID=U2FF38_9MOLU|nr:hypothetical protein [Haloplasma contractile]ERJ11520.1 hypothetical protein HLPCO_002432 [Haloplasma contractile SSD-17B]